MTNEVKQQIAALVVARSGQPLPPNVAAALGVKPTATANAPGAAGATDAKTDAAASTVKPNSDSAAIPPGGLENEAQVTAAVGTQRSGGQTEGEKGILRGSPDHSAWPRWPRKSSSSMSD